jgi:hypothetical protein
MQDYLKEIISRLKSDGPKENVEFEDYELFYNS